MSSRDPADLWPQLRNRLHVACVIYHRAYGRDHAVRVICTYRSELEQEDLHRASLAGGPRASRAGESLHNYRPSAAFDIGIFGVLGQYLAGEDDLVWYERFGEICESIGLEFGGRWPGKKQDPSHIQVRGYTWEMARQNTEPRIPPIPAELMEV